MASNTPITIRLATSDDVPYIPAIESASDQLFREVNMHSIAEGGAPTPEAFAQYQSRGHLWVATDASKSESESSSQKAAPPIAFIQIKIYNSYEAMNSVFIHQVSIIPDYARRGIGRQLMDFVEDWAKEKGFRALDLTTFDEVPWNRSYYERLGYNVLRGEEYEKDNAREIRERLELEQKDEALKAWRRVAMRKYL